MFCVCAFRHLIKVGSVLGEEKLCILPVMVEKDPKGGEKRGAAAEGCCSLFTKHVCFLGSPCESNSTAERKKKIT